MFKKLLLVLMISYEAVAINLRLLDGTAKELSDNQLEYAPFQGVPFAEALAENLYDQNAKDIVSNIRRSIETSQNSSKATPELKNEIEKYLENFVKNDSSTSKLVGLMFYRAGGQFQLTEAPNNPVAQLTPNNIGALLKIIYDSRLDAPKIKVDLKSKLKDYLISLQLKKLSGSLFAGGDFNPFINALVGSLEESDQKNLDALYAPGTTEGILLGYMLKRCNTKQDLQEYLIGFTGRDIILPDVEYFEQEINTILKKMVSLYDPKAFGDWLTCAFYQKNYMSDLPKITSNTIVKYQEIYFPDCVESTILNLCNIVTYSGSMLGVNPKGIKMSSALAQFYSQDKTNNPAEVSNNKVHQAWVDVIENMPGVSYNRVKVTTEQYTIAVPDQYEGFMPIDDSMISAKELATLPKIELVIGIQKIVSFEKAVGGVKYLLIPQHSEFSAYEVLPTVSNITVVLNNLFDLKLYNQSDIFTQDFVENNFSKVCIKLGWDLRTSVTNNIKSATIDIYKNHSCFVIHLSRKTHGYVNVKENNKQNLLIDEKFILNNSYQKHPQEVSKLMSLINTNISMEDLLKLAGDNFQMFLQLLKNLDLRNRDKKVGVITDILKMNLKNNKMVDTYLAQLILSLGVNDRYYFKRVLKSCHKDRSDFIKSSLRPLFDIFWMKNNEDAIDLSCDAFEIGLINSKEAILLIKEGIKSQSRSICQSSLDLLTELVKQNEIHQAEVMLFIEEGMKKIHNTYFYKPCLNVLIELVKKNVISKEEMMQFLKKTIDSVVHLFEVELSRIVDIILSVRDLDRITKEYIFSYLAKIINSSAESYLLSANIFDQCFLSLKHNKITRQDFLLLLEQIMKLNDKETQDAILGFLDNSRFIITEKELIPILRQAIKSNNLLIRNRAHSLAKKNKLPFNERAYLSGLGLLKKTGIISMRHDPFTVTGYADKPYDNYLKTLRQLHKFQEMNPYIDLDAEKQKMVHQKQLLDPALTKWQNANNGNQFEKMQRIQPLLPFMIQQKSTAANFIPKIKPKEIVRVGIRK